MDPDKLKKVAAIARNPGSEGERKAALRILSNHGYSLSDFEDEKKKQNIVYLQLSYKDKFEKKLILQVYSKIMNTFDIEYYQISKKSISIEISKDKEKHFFDSINSVKLHYRKELIKFQSAFIHKLRLFPDENVKVPNIDKPKELSKEEIRDILSMAIGVTEMIFDPLLEGD